MLRVLHPISAQVFEGITQLFEYYFYCVYNFFAVGAAQPWPAPPLKLRNALLGIRQRIIRQDVSQLSDDAPPASPDHRKLNLDLPGKSVCIVQLSGVRALSRCCRPEPCR